jgi:hypothetical protein
MKSPGLTLMQLSSGSAVQGTANGLLGEENSFAVSNVALT